jgi:hypothetical protein
VIDPMRRPLPDNTQQETDIYDPAWIRTRNPSKRAAAILERVETWIDHHITVGIIIITHLPYFTAF